MKKYKTVALVSCLVAASGVHAQTSGTAPQGTTNPEARSVAPATPIPNVPQQLGPVTDVGTLCNDCAPAARTGPWQSLWFKAGYSVWKISDSQIPYPLLTTGTGPLPGVIGGDDTVVLYGANHVDFNTFQGLTFEGGMWLDQAHLNGLGFGLQFFNTQNSNASFSSNGTDGISLSRPFFDVTQNLNFQNNILQVSTDGRAGTYDVSNSSKFGGFDVYYQRNLVNDCRFSLNAIVGYRYFQLTEELNQRQVSTTLPDSNAQPLILDNTIVDQLTLTDSFRTKNQINGVELGLKGEWNWGTFYAGGSAKVTLGSNRQSLDINGSTTGVIDGSEVTLPGSLNALTSTRDGFTSNIGSTRYNQFIIMPELGVYAGVQVTSRVRVQLGYDCL